MKIKKIASLVLSVIAAAVMTVLPVSAQTVAADMLPSKEWSGEGTLNPIDKGNGTWFLKTSPTMDGGSAVSYFDNTYHKGQMIAYDFTVDGDEDANITIYIGFIRELAKDVYPQGEEGYQFTKHLAESLGIEATGDEKATLPGGTYKGVFDPGDYFYEGFDKFQHVAFYVGGEGVTVRQFAFVNGATAGAETYPEPKKESVSSDTKSENNNDKIDAPANDASNTQSESNGQSVQLSYTIIIIAVSIAVICLAAVIVMAIVLVKTKKKQG